jgi:hypothetical protein
MGEGESKPAKPTGPPPPDMMEVLIGMKMKAKMFEKSASKALKEKQKYYELAKKQMKSGNEDGAQMYLELAQQKQAENTQFMRMNIRLQTLAVQIKSKQNSVDMVNNLNSITPILEMQSTNMPIEQMYMKLESFNTAYDDLTIKGNILDAGMEKTLGEKGGYKDVNNMMQGLKAEVAMEDGVSPDFNVNANANAEQTQNKTPANNDFYNDLKNL